MKAVFEADALAEYQEAAAYSQEHFGAGRQFVAAVQAAIASIENDPELYQEVGQGIRIYRMKRFPFYIFYRVDAGSETIVIYALAHHRRQPGYWKNRQADR